MALVPVFPLVHNATYEYAQPTNYQTPEVLVGGGFYAQKTTTSLTAPTTTTGITYDGTNTFLVVETEGTKISFQIGGAEYAWLDNAGTLHANTLAAVNYFYSPNHDTAAAGALTIGGTNATSIAIGKAGVTVNVPGSITAGNIVGTGRATLRDNSLENRADASDSGETAINYYGYNGAGTYYRNLNVYSGKGGSLFAITGSTGIANAAVQLQEAGSRVWTAVTLPNYTPNSAPHLANINSPTYGWQYWDTSTTNSPPFGYGTMLAWPFTGTSMALTSGNWVYEWGISTDNPPSMTWRSNINGSGWSAWCTAWTNQSLTNLSQLTNGPGYLTGATLPVGSASQEGILKVGANLTVSGGVVSLTSGNVTGALGFTPYNASNPSGYYASGASPSFATVTASTNVVTPSLDTASAVALNIGAGNATSIALGRSGVVVNVPGTLHTSTVDTPAGGGTLSIGSAGNAATVNIVPNSIVNIGVSGVTGSVNLGGPNCGVYVPSIDTPAGTSTLAIAGANATTVTIGKAGVTVNAPGTLQMAGATVVYGDSNGVGSLNTAPSVGGVGANAIPRSCFYRDNNEQFGALGVNIQHPTASGYQAQFACLGYDGITWMARAKQSGTWGGTTYLFGTGNYNSGCHQPSSSPWITPALISPWTNYGGGWPPFGYYKDPTGRVYVRGAICGGSVNTDCYQLVAGYRPGYAQSFPINCGSNAFGTAVVYANGNIAIAPPTNTAYLDLSTISFYADG